MLVITGGGGFLGSVLAAALNEAGRTDLVLVDRFGTDEKWRNIAKRDFYEIVSIDGLEAWLKQFGDKVEGVFHLGAISSTTATDADAVISANLNYSISLWRWCAASRTRLVYASSAATYGAGKTGFDDRRDLAALKLLQPLNLYGWSKHAFDVWAMRAAAKDHAPPFWAGLKFFNVYGPNEYHKGDMMSLVAKNYQRVATRQTIRLFKSHLSGVADGDQRRDFVYVKDCVAAALWLMQAGQHSGVFNLGSGRAHSFRELMEALGEACGTPPVIEYVDMPEAIRPNYQYFTQANIEKLRAAGYQAPFSSLKNAVADYVGQYLAGDRYL